MNSVTFYFMKKVQMMSIHTKDESSSTFAFVFGVNWPWRFGVTASFGVFFHEVKCNGKTSFIEFLLHGLSSSHFMAPTHVVTSLMQPRPRPLWGWGGSSFLSQVHINFKIYQPPQSGDFFRFYSHESFDTSNDSCYRPRLVGLTLFFNRSRCSAKYSTKK